MKNVKTLKLFTDVRKSLSKKSPEIMVGIGIAGMITTVVLAVKATPKAMSLINDAEYEKGNGKVRVELTKREVVKVTWKPFVPVVVTGTLSTACVIFGYSVKSRRMVALATAYKLSETALNEFKEKTAEIVGEKKLKDIKKKISEDRVKENPVGNTEVIVTGLGKVRFYEPLSGRYFESDIVKIDKAINELNYQMQTAMYISLNEFYSAIGLPNTKLGSYLGWRIDRGLIEIDKMATKDEDGNPCLSLDYSYAPEYGYDNLY